MKFLGSARALVLAVAVVTEVAGLGLAVLPALAAPAPPPGSHPDITITAGGDRTSGNAVSGTAGVRFSVPNASPNDCTTAANGTCSVSSAAGSRRTITQENAPDGWFTSPELAISPNSSTSNVAERDYSALTTNVPQSGVDVPASTSGTTTNPTARSGVWAVSRQEPVIPPHCGLNVALLFDLSFSVQGHLRQVQDAGIGYVNALAGTPSSVALFTMGTHAPVNSTNNSNFPLTPVTTSTNVAALTNKIRGYTVLTNPAQYTNLDQGLWQIASAEGPPGGTRVHYDAVIVISDGDPSVYGPAGIGQTFTGITRFIDIENAIFSANALKAKDTKVISVGVNSSRATTLNLRAISGRVEGSDYFVTNTGDLEEVLHDLALTNCGGTVNVTNLVIPLTTKSGISTAVPAPGWTLHATGETVSPAVAVTNETGASSFTTSAVTEPVNVTEEVASGHQHVPVDGKNAVCTNLEGASVPVANTTTPTGPGFTVTTQANDVITCNIYNEQLAPSVVTTRLSAAGGQIPVNGSASDAATLHSVNSTAGGTVEYRYYGSQAACQSATAASPPAGGTLVSTVTVTNGAAPPSAAATFPAAGTFYWAAFYSGDTSNLPAASDCATEPLVVTQAQSRVTTELSAATGEIPVGGSATDSATLQGVTGTAGGTVEYRHYTSLTACQSATAASPPRGTLVSTRTVTNGAVPPSAAATFPAAGTFYWAAFYSGDTNNRATASDCATEPLVVTPAPSEVTTQLSAASREIAVGAAATDSATLHGVTSTAGGTVEYRHYNSLTACQSATAAAPPAGGTLVSTVTVSGGAVPPSAAATFPAAGTFYWAAFYSGDTNNGAAASDCAAEPLVVTPAPSQVTTELSAADAEIPVDGSAHDTATLHGVTSTAGGTVEYRHYNSLSACQSATLTFPPASGGTLVSTKTVTNGAVPASAAATFPDAGTFYWAAFYSGDTSNQADASHCATEPLVVTQAVSRVTTVLSAAGGEIPVGGSATDSATLHGVTSTAVGSIEFRYYGSPAACDTDVAAFPGTAPLGGARASTETVTNGAAPPSDAASFPTAWTFYWAAFYSGGPNNLPSASDCATEPLVVTPAPSRVTTRLSAAGGQTPVDGSVSDTATLNGVTGTAGGTVDYRYYGSLSACDSDVAAFPGTAPLGGTRASIVTVANGAAPTSEAAKFPDAGTFYWAAFYSGDADDLAAASDCATEPLVVTQAVSRVTTVLSAAGGKIPVGGSATDSATLHGVTSTAVGSIEFRYYGSPAACDTDVAAFPGTAPSGGTAVSTEIVTNGAAPPSDAASFPTAGTFYWAAFYSGGPNNLPSASDCATEPLVVKPADSQVTTELSAAAREITVGDSASDAATLHDVTGAAGGTVEYHNYDSLAACDTDVAAFPRTAPPSGTLVSTVTVANGTVPSSAAVAFPNAGTFYWAAFYSGDTNNLPAASRCATEPLLVTSAQSEVTTRLSAADGEIAVSGTASDSVTLNAVPSTAGGTVDYRYYDSLSACDTDVAAFPATDPSGGTRASTETVTNGTVPSSAAATFPNAGTFYWAAFYSGDTGIKADASACAAEPLVVTPAQSQVTTVLSAGGGEIAVDGSASDAATLIGVTGTGGGTVEYRLYGSTSACDGDVTAFPGTNPSGGTLVSKEIVASGAAPSSVPHTFGAAGTFYWAAFYSGDTNNRADASDCATEPLVVTPAKSQVTTQLSATDGQVPVDGTASDSATAHDVTGTAGGTMEYRYYDSQAACETDVAAFPGAAPSGGTLVSSETVTNGAVPRSSAVTFHDAGTVYWTAFYSGDVANLPAASDCATEPLVVTQAQSRVTTVLSVAGGQFGVGGSASDAATLPGVAGTAGGTVEYRFYDALSACESDVAGFRRTAPSGGTPVSTEPVTNGAVPPSAARTFPVAGTFYWAAFYSGDPNNRAAASDCATEPLVVTPAQSQVTTQLSASGGQIPVDALASDAATLLEVADTAGGTVEYRYYDSLSACQTATAASPPASGGTVVSTEPVTNGVAPRSAAVAFPDAGTFYWAAFYSGDASDAPAASDCATEPLVVTGAPSQVTTVLSAASGEIPVDGPVSDSATVTGVTGTAGGTVEYRFYDSLSACDADVAAFPVTAPLGGTPVSTETVNDGAVPPSAAQTFPAAGTFYWAAFYSGDPSNQADASDCATEPLVVTAAQSRVTTQLSAANREIPVGGSASDSATLTGVTGTAGGTVEYRFYNSLSACLTASAASPPAGGTLVSAVLVAGGVVPPSAAHTFGAAGTFYWAAFYSGDPGNQAAASDCTTEPLVVTPAPSQVTTELSAADAEIQAGESATDTATLHGVTGTAGGTMEYLLYTAPSVCDRDAAAFPGTAPSLGLLVSTETVTNGVAPPSAAHTFPKAATLYWAAFYSGDAANRPAASDCATEPLVITTGPPASVIVHMDWVIDGVVQRVPSQDPDFQASLVLTTPAPVPSGSAAETSLVTTPGSSGAVTPLDPAATWGQEQYGYAIGQDIHIALTDETVPPGCSHAVAGHLGVQTIDQSKDEFLVTATATCDQAPTEPGEGTHLTLVKRISNLLNPAQVPLTSWTLTARPEPGGPPVISGTTGVTANVEPGVPYVLAESAVPGYKQLPDPALLELVSGATGSWRCVETGPGGQSGLQDFDGGTGDVIVQPGRHATCTALNRHTLAIPVGPAQTGGGLTAASRSVPAVATGLALMAAGALLGLGGLRLRRKPRSASKA